MRFARRSFLAAVAVVAAGLGAACSDSIVASPDTPGPPPAGEYALTAVGGAPLPAVMGSDASKRVELIAGRLTLAAGGSFSQVLTFRETTYGGGGGTSERQSVVNGSVTLSGSRLRFQVVGGGSFEGTLFADRIEYTVQGNYGPLVFVFQKL